MQIGSLNNWILMKSAHIWWHYICELLIENTIYMLTLFWHNSWTYIMYIYNCQQFCVIWILFKAIYVPAHACQINLTEEICSNLRMFVCTQHENLSVILLLIWLHYIPVWTNYIVGVFFVISSSSFYIFPEHLFLKLLVYPPLALFPIMPDLHKKYWGQWI